MNSHGKNQDFLRAYSQANEEKKKYITLETNDAYAEILYNDSTRRKVEFYYGEGYLSQGARGFGVSEDTKEIYVIDYYGKKSKNSLHGCTF